MTKEKFDEQVVNMIRVLHSISYSLLLNPHDQADAVQECIKKALTKRESLKDDSRFKAWLIRILINECHNIQRRRSRIIPSEKIEIIIPASTDEELFEVVNGLQEKLRLPLVLHYVSGYTTKEIAKILGIHESSVKYRLVSARKQIKKTFAEGSEGIEAI